MEHLNEPHQPGAVVPPEPDQESFRPPPEERYDWTGHNADGLGNVVDAIESGETAGGAVPLRSSVDKLGDLVDLLSTIEPEDEGSARTLQFLTAVAPHVGPLLPDDPDRLDEMLLVLARHALLARSDWALEPTTITELLEGGEPGEPS